MPMHEDTTDDQGPHRWTLRGAIHVLGAMRDFWASGLNRAAVELINPQPGTTLLDIGAGVGPATVEAADRIGPGGRVIAVDPSTAMRGALRVRRLWQSSRLLIEVRDGSAEDLPVATGSVDAAFALNAAHHFNNIELAAPEMARVLKPGGHLLLIDEDFVNTDHPYYRHHRDADGPEPADAAHIAELLTAAGLIVTHTDHHPIAGVTATVISATAPGSHPTSEGNHDPSTGGTP
jgi:SAM-dependent methyltransferase